MRCIQSVYCVEKMLLRILRRGHGTGIETVHLLVHDRIFDLGASYVKTMTFIAVPSAKLIFFLIMANACKK